MIIRRWQLVRIATYRISLGNFVGNYNVINYNVGNCTDIRCSIASIIVDFLLGICYFL